MSYRPSFFSPRIVQGLALLLSLAATGVEAKVKYVSPEADAQVSSGAAASTNFGSSTAFCLQSSSGSASCGNTPMGNSRAWLRFNLEGQIPAGATITSAKLRFYQFDTDFQNDDLAVEVRGGADAWDESTINWNNQPAPGASAYGPVTVNGGDEFRWYEVDVTALVTAEWTGDQAVSLVVKPVTEGDTQWRTHRFNTREYSNNGAPRLLIEYTGDWSTADPIDVIHFNDIHARILPHDYDVPEGASDTPELESIGGAAYLASKILELKQAKPDALVLGGGDYSEGSPIGDLEGNRGVIEIYQVLDAELKALGGRGLDAEVVGNHDVRKRSMITNVKNSGLPFLSLNLLCGLDPAGIDASHPLGTADPTCPDVVAAEAGQPVPYFDPYRVLTVDGKRIGILGYSTDDSSHLGTVAEVGAAEATEHLLEVAEVRWTPDLAPVSPRDDPPNTIYLKDLVKKLRDPIAAGGEEVDIVIMLSHIGHRRLNATDDILLGSNSGIAPPDLVVAGHWHTTTGTVWQPSNLNYDTIVAEAASYAQYVGEVQLSADGNYLAAVKHPIRTAEITPNAAVVSKIADLKAEYDSSVGSCILDPAGPTNVHPCDVDRVVGYSAVDLRLDKDKWFTHSEFPWSGDNTAGQWIADGMAWKGTTSTAPGSVGVLAIQSGGGIRRDVKAGDITYGDIYEVYPWQDDQMVRVELTGQQIRDYLESKFVGASISKDWLVTADDGQITSVRYQGNPISLTGTYTVFISEYMYRYEDWISETGGDVTFAAADPTPTFLGLRIRDAVVEYTAQFPDAATPLTVPGPRYVLNTEFAGTFRAVVTMVNDAENEPYFEAVFVRLLDALPDTVARRTGYGLANIVEPNGSINPQTQWRETMLYRSHLGFPDGVLKVGDIITIKGEGGFFAGNPQFVDQEGIYADATEFELHGSDPSLALPEYHASFDTFWDEFHENHLVQVRVTRTGDDQVRDASGNTYSLYKEGGFYSVVKLPGSNGDTLEITGVQTQRGEDRRFRLREAVVVSGTDFPPSSAVAALAPASQTVAPVLLSASASDLNASAGTSSTLGPVADSQVVSGSPTTNYGTSQNLFVQSAPVSNSFGNERAWLRFDLSGLPAGAVITSARVELYQWRTSNGNGGNLLVDMHAASDDSWAETGINWNNQPAFDASALASVTLVAGTRATYSFDVTPRVVTEAAGDDLISLVVKPRTETTANTFTFAFDSKEWGTASQRPRLVVEYTVPGGGQSPGTVSQVDFFARQSTDGGSTWGAWALVGSDAAGPTWEYAFTPSGFGLYEFYSIATDSTGSVEPAPVYADAELTFTSLPPDAPFNPSIGDGATDVSGVSSIGISVSDPDSATVDVCFYQAGSPATLIGCVTGVPSGSVASVAWSGLADGTTYSWYAIATDAAGVQTQSATFGFTTAAAPAAVNVPMLNWLAQVALLLALVVLGSRYLPAASRYR